MKTKLVAGILLIVVLIGVCAASLFAAWQGMRLVQNSGIRLGGVRVSTVAAKATEEKLLTVNGAVDLNVQNDMGDISVQTGVDGQVHVTSEKTAWGIGEADAQAALKDLKVVIEQKGNSIKITVQQPPEVDMLHVGPGAGSVKFTISVPKETGATLHSSNGDVSLEGTTGNADLQSDFGKISATDITGSLNAKSDNGSVTARKITSTGPVTLVSYFGDVELNTGKAGDVKLSSNNGKIAITHVTASGPLDITDQFGNIDASDSQVAELRAKSNNGAIRLDRLSMAGGLNAESDFGDLILTDVSAGSYSASTQNGKVSVDGGHGAITAHSNLGDISITNAENAVIDLSSNNGTVSFSGSLGAGPHTVSSDFGDIQLSLPAGTGLNVDLQTDFGKISSDFSITVKGTLDPEHSVGSINGGGASLKVKTNNGNITLQSFK